MQAPKKQQQPNPSTNYFPHLSLPQVHAEGMTTYPEPKQHIKLSESSSNTEDILLPNVKEIWTALRQ